MGAGRGEMGGWAYRHDLDVGQLPVERLLGPRGQALLVEQFRVREHGELEDGHEEEARAPDEVADELDEEHPWPRLEREQRVAHADVEPDGHAEVVLLHTQGARQRTGVLSVDSVAHVPSWTQRQEDRAQR